jgi:ABC-2 type transport system permease protein
MSRYLRLYRVLFVVSFQQIAQYRLQSLLWLLLVLIRPVVFLAAWSAAATAQGGTIGSFSIGDFAAYYICLTLVAQLGREWNSYEFEVEVRQGKLAPKLLRPLHPLHYAIVDNLVFKMYTLPILLLVLGFIAWTFNARFQTQLWHVALFIPSMMMAAALQFMLGWMLASLAFWTTRVHGIVHLYDRLAFIFAGQIAPLSLLPGPLAVISYALPFGYMLGLPAEILRGGPTLDQALLILLGQAAWLAASCLGYVVVWRKGLRQFSAVGA